MRSSYEAFLCMCGLTAFLGLGIIISFIFNKERPKSIYIPALIILLAMVSYDVSIFVNSSQTIHYGYNIYSLNQDENEKFSLGFEKIESNDYVCTIVKDDENHFVEKKIELEAWVKFVYNDNLTPSIVIHTDAWDVYTHMVITVPSQDNLEFINF